MAFVSAVPGYQGYMPLMHGQPITHTQAAVHGQPMMNNQPAVHYQPVRHGQMQQTISNRDVPQQSSSLFVPEAPSEAS
ncbi:hypothetical protein DPMN_064893 [Dreissena polymorpha]|uniref:Uncharacterized protein n=1 Tax=Dreissena polymorpha TaxID=45954 RepID=A0A9D4CDZ4_DREPO|nr:hypothetical protein DPMN_064893 [Dreissena polymorpha]